MRYPLDPGFANVDTSIDAAEDIKPRARTLRLKVYNALEVRLVIGCTAYELSDILGEPYHSVQPRTSELCAAGWIEDSGMRRKSEQTGKNCIVWRITEKQGKLF